VKLDANLEKILPVSYFIVNIDLSDVMLLKSSQIIRHVNVSFENPKIFIMTIQHPSFRIDFLSEHFQHRHLRKESRLRDKQKHVLSHF